MAQDKRYPSLPKKMMTGEKKKKKKDAEKKETKATHLSQ